MAIVRYQQKISGPLLDRIDIHVEVPRVDYEKLADNRSFWRDSPTYISERSFASPNLVKTIARADTQPCFATKHTSVMGREGDVLP